MKELSIEEKAKRYDEALRVLHKYDGANIMFSQSLKEEMFPELKEPENEKIIQFLIHEVKETSDEIMSYRGMNKEAVLAWLEKQGKKTESIEGFDTEFERQISHIIASIINKEYEYTEDSVKRVSNALLNYAKHEFEKQGEQNLSDIDNKFIRMRETKPKDISEFLNRLTTVEQEFLWEHIAKIRKLDKEEQKPSWSAEDEEMYKEVLTDIIYAKNDLKATGCHELSKRAMEAFNWFSNRYKSLKPQSTWKPSELQIETLNDAIVICAERDYETECRLDNLRQELKKLREE